MKLLLFVLSLVFLAPGAWAEGAGAGQAVPPARPVGAEVTDMELVCAAQVEMGTPFRICVYAKKADKLSVQFDLHKAFRKIREINDWMSEWRPGTELSRVNEAAGARPVRVRKELFDLLAYTRTVSEATDGAFDPSFNAFWGLYDFKADSKREPTEEQIRERLPLVNYRNIELEPEKRTVFLKKPGMKIGFGGIGQGYGCDAVIADLKKHYSAGFVDGSGDTYFWGRKPNGQLWITAIRDPRDKRGNVARIYGTDFAITTAGDDERFFMVGSRRVHHIIDPKTGRSAKASRQVTVIAPTATEADAYDTATFVLGPEKGRKVLEAKGLQGVFITDQGVTFTKGLKKTQTAWGEVYVVENQTDDTKINTRTR